MNIIKKTTNYSQFKFLAQNREPNPRYLIESISQKNLLAEHPIICDTNLNIIDGQNRLRAAESLKVPIFYLVSENVSIEDISRCQIQKTWVLSDYLKYYGTREEYNFIQELMFTYKVPIHFAVSCCNPDRHIYQLFRRGKFRIVKDKEEIIVAMKNLVEIHAFLRDLLKNTGKKDVFLYHKLKEALWIFVTEKEYDHARMMHALNQYPEHALDCMRYNSKTTIVSCLKTRVYNFKRYKKKME